MIGDDGTNIVIAIFSQEYILQKGNCMKYNYKRMNIIIMLILLFQSICAHQEKESNPKLTRTVRIWSMPLLYPVNPPVSADSQLQVESEESGLNCQRSDINVFAVTRTDDDASAVIEKKVKDDQDHAK